MKKIVLILGVTVVLTVGYVVFYFRQTKSHSPEGNVEFADGDLKIHVFYNRPYKKGRVIFGNLVPYGKTWRTGANEATTFETNSNLIFGDKELKAGKYSLWTVPSKNSWQVVFNSVIPNWGVKNFKGEASRDPANDVLVVEAPVVEAEKVFEQFAISVEKVGEGDELIFIWDQTLVSVPFSKK